MRQLGVGASVILLALLAGCTDGVVMETAVGNVPKSLVVTSPAYATGAAIPSKFTCDGEDVSPALRVGSIPKGAKALALIIDDPDAPKSTWTHWTAWNLRPNMTEIPEGADVAKLGGREGTTSAGSIGYHGPCPPGGTHRYFVRVYALKAPLDLSEGATRKQFDDALAGNVLAWGELMGTYRRG